MSLGAGLWSEGDSLTLFLGAPRSKFSGSSKTQGSQRRPVGRLCTMLGSVFPSFRNGSESPMPSFVHMSPEEGEEEREVAPRRGSPMGSWSLHACPAAETSGVAIFLHSPPCTPDKSSHQAGAALRGQGLPPSDLQKRTRLLSHPALSLPKLRRFCLAPSDHSRWRRTETLRLALSSSLSRILV